MKIPKVIHQIWVDKENKEPPKLLKELSETWKGHHPDWKFLLWNECDIYGFFREFFPEFTTLFLSYKYEIQRLDVIRYLILYNFGGLYIDLDYECLEPIDDLLGDHHCCLPVEPDRHREFVGLDLYISNYFMAASPGNDFFKSIIEILPKMESKSSDKMQIVLETTGPLMLTRFYQNYDAKEEIFLVPSKYVAPLDLYETRELLSGQGNGMLEQKIQEAYCIHYFFGSWTK